MSENLITISRSQAAKVPWLKWEEVKAMSLTPESDSPKLQIPGDVWIKYVAQQTKTASKKKRGCGCKKKKKK